MTPLEVAEAARHRVAVAINQDELDDLSAAAELLREVDTKLSGPLRQFVLGDVHLVQERSDKGELLVRRFELASDAAAFVETRLATYERMWDGCGCRVDYHGR